MRIPTILTLLGMAAVCSQCGPTQSATNEQASFQSWENSASYIISVEDKGYALSKNPRGSSRSGVVLLEKYTNDEIPDQTRERLLKLMQGAIDRGQVDRWIILRLRSYGRSLAGHYEGGTSSNPF